MKEQTSQTKWPIKTITVVALTIVVGVGLELMRRHFTTPNFTTPSIQEIFTKDLEMAELQWKSVQAQEKPLAQQIFSTCASQLSNIGCNGYRLTRWVTPDNWNAVKTDLWKAFNNQKTECYEFDYNFPNNDQGFIHACFGSPHDWGNPRFNWFTLREPLN